ncbi:hypothetical protein C1H46_018674 [Malus baccata]|uniref:Uncharacterized protein n=1 Tax=Malus baccata TaxID=106549 RepID=A0A540MAG3_MALBA|nr:hypothetical protein C1H46_018674 [Malus baccata]
MTIVRCEGSWKILNPHRLHLLCKTQRPRGLSPHHNSPLRGPQFHQTTTSSWTSLFLFSVNTEVHKSPHFSAKHHHRTTTIHSVLLRTHRRRPFTAQSVLKCPVLP